MIEAAARGVPSVVVAGQDNAAVELVEDGVNGVVASTVDARALAAAIVQVQRNGPTLRASASEWFRSRQDLLALSGSLDHVIKAYD